MHGLGAESEPVKCTSLQAAYFLDPGPADHAGPCLTASNRLSEAIFWDGYGSIPFTLAC